MAGAAVGHGGRFHAHKARQAAEEAAGDESEGSEETEETESCHGQQNAEHHHEENGHAFVLPLQVGGGAAAHRIGDLLHLRRSHGLRLHPPEHGGGKDQRQHRAAATRTIAFIKLRPSF